MRGRRDGGSAGMRATESPGHGTVRRRGRSLWRVSAGPQEGGQPGHPVSSIFGTARHTFPRVSWSKARHGARKVQTEGQRQQGAMRTQGQKPSLGASAAGTSPAPSHPSPLLGLNAGQSTASPGCARSPSPIHAPVRPLSAAPGKVGTGLPARGQSPPRECPRGQRSPGTAASSPGGERSHMSPCYSCKHHQGQNSQAWRHPTASPSPGIFTLPPMASPGRRLPWHQDHHG